MSIPIFKKKSSAGGSAGEKGEKSQSKPIFRSAENRCLEWNV